jgi:hypothetical protein
MTSNTEPKPRQVVFDVKGGQPVQDFANLDASACLARKREVEARLPATRDVPELAAERARLVAENDALSARLREHKEAQKRENARRNFAGLGSPLHEAAIALLDAKTVAELESTALKNLVARERASAERKAAKGTP